TLGSVRKYRASRTDIPAPEQDPDDANNKRRKRFGVFHLGRVVLEIVVAQRDKLVPAPELDQHLTAGQPCRHSANTITEPACQRLAELVVLESVLELIKLLERRSQIRFEGLHAVSTYVSLIREPERPVVEKLRLVTSTSRGQVAPAGVERHEECLGHVDQLRNLQRLVSAAESPVEVTDDVQHRAKLRTDRCELGLSVGITPIGARQHRDRASQPLDAGSVRSFQLVDSGNACQVTRHCAGLSQFFIELARTLEMV